MTEIELIGIATAVAGGICFFTAMTGTGSGLVLVPLLIAFGVPPVSAIAIHKLEASVWTTVSAFQFWKKREFYSRDFPWFLIFGAIGTFLGARMIHFVPDETVKNILGIAILAVVGWMIFWEKFRKNLEKSGKLAGWERGILIFSMLIFGLYEGTFGSGNGYFITALFLTFLPNRELKIVGMITILAAFWNWIAVGVHVSFGSILWNWGVPIATGSAIGAYFGAKFALKKGRELVRRVILISAVIAAGILYF